MSVIPAQNLNDPAGWNFKDAANSTWIAQWYALLYMAKRHYIEEFI
jgi:hypothetical protein